MKRHRSHHVVTVRIFLLAFVIGEVLTEKLNSGKASLKICLVQNDDKESPDQDITPRHASYRLEANYTNEQYKARPTRMLIHGWLHWTGDKKLFSLAGTYKKFHPNRFNLVIVHWDPDTRFNYKAREYAKNKVAPKVAKFLDENLGSDVESWRNLQIIGHSFGAHIAGFIGKYVKNGTVGTIIGLDPASMISKIIEFMNKLR